MRVDRLWLVRGVMLTTVALLFTMATTSWADDPPSPAPSPISPADERDRRYEEKFRAIEQRFGAFERNIETALTAAEKLYEQRFAAQKEAVSKAESAAEKRFDSVNEFRGQLKDQAATFVPRSEFDLQLKAFTALAARVDRMEGSKEGKSDSWAFFVAALGAVALIVGLYAGIQGRKGREPRGNVES